MQTQLKRRHHKRFVTRNTEYHLRDEICVAVRDRDSGDWIEDHIAVGRNLAGGLLWTPTGYVPAKAWAGVSLWFDAGGMDIVTSTVQAVDRPGKHDVSAYV